MIKAFVGNQSLKRAVEIRVVCLGTRKSKNFSIQVDQNAKEKDYDIEKIKDLLQRLLDEHVRNHGGLKL